MNEPRPPSNGVPTVQADAPEPRGASDGETADFGFRAVPRAQKASLVRGVFDSVAGRYDLMNDLMSGGVHRVWKGVLIDRLNPQPGQRLLDVAGGTGDVALRWLQRAGERPRRAETARAEAILCDVNYEMVAAGRTRRDMAPVAERLSRVVGDAERLPLPDRCVDVYTIAFGIRNVTDRAAALSEAFRVLKPGGRFACLEFSRPASEALARVYDAYSFRVIPWLGERVANDRESYQYLVESIRAFPTQDAFAAMIGDAGFSRVRYENLTGGVAALHTGWRT